MKRSSNPGHTDPANNGQGSCHSQLWVSWYLVPATTLAFCWSTQNRMKVFSSKLKIVFPPNKINILFVKFQIIQRSIKQSKKKKSLSEISPLGDNHG